MLTHCPNCKTFYVAEGARCLNCGIITKEHKTIQQLYAAETENLLIYADRRDRWEQFDEKTKSVLYWSALSVIVLTTIGLIYSQKPEMQLLIIICIVGGLTALAGVIGALTGQLLSKIQLKRIEKAEGIQRALDLRARLIPHSSDNSLLSVEREISNRFESLRDSEKKIDQIKGEMYREHRTPLETARRVIKNEQAELKSRQHRIDFMRWQNKVVGWTEMLPNPISIEQTESLLKTVASLKKEASAFATPDVRDESFKSIEEGTANAIKLLDKIKTKLEARQVALTLNQLQPAAVQNFNEKIWLEETAALMELQENSFNEKDFFVTNSADYAGARLEFLEKLQLERV